ncbi:NIPSNAP family protein [Catenuloplanes atrovinosus]|uniref:NIPSNAP domain-containing protein n=1 Tax=Catenuloplanes atrovinosus TaxID=137266 RepID=A0AAE3YR86_9ACTN|nr:NIPSNAP family protein [Catenuloplanes atrovinosus]MDR7278374.1 hypothetical protein [Catenuloplanes atrovinosus]
MAEMGVMVVELRRYRTHPGARDDLIELFEREFIEPQEAAGAAILGQFRDLDDPDRFVWLRGFRDMRSRRAALETFYSGPVWREHRDAANRTMVAWDDVLLLRMPEPAVFDTGARAPLGSPVPATTINMLIQYSDAPPPTPTTPSALVTEYAENDYPALPVRTGVHAIVAWSDGPIDDSTLPPGRTERMRLAPTARSWLR